MKSNQKATADTAARQKWQTPGIPSRKTREARGIGHALAQCRNYGKLILFGEHFVVYKVPALVGAVAATAGCTANLWRNPVSK